MERRTKRPAPEAGGGRTNHESGTPSSLTRSISPPARSKRARILEPADDDETSSEAEQENDGDQTSSKDEPPSAKSEEIKPPPRRVFRSPFQLTKIQGLEKMNPEYNIDTVSLKDILGEPLISECWEFNYLHDIDFLMGAFDEDVRHLVKVHVVHGFWKKEDPNRLALAEAASRYSNVTIHSAFMPEMFGTHHSKMMILLRHDDTAQIVIHTANLIMRDWTNMTQGIWRSPLLPLLSPAQQVAVNSTHPENLRTGSGEKFKVDFLNYLRSYDTRRVTCAPITEELRKYDFSCIRGSLIASVPGRHNIHDDSPTRWGWAAMKQTLKSVPVQSGRSDIVIQISSIATLGPTDNWLKNTLFNALSTGRRSQPTTAPSSMTLTNQPPKPDFKVVFPTPDEIRASLDGYASGGSIHTKIQSAQQKKQLQYLKPIFHHWANDTPNQETPTTESSNTNNAGRNRAAPHIKTYIRYGGKSHETATIDWALLTSANLSKQAWGEAAVVSSGEMRIASYEIGVLVWPGLFAEGAVMRGVFSKDIPDEEEGGGVVVGLRMPYSLPLRRYGQGEMPWVATASYEEVDWMGRVWKD